MTGTPTARVDWRAVTAYVLISYVLMWLVCLPLWVTGRGLDTPGALVIIGVAMFSPALASWLVCWFLTHTPCLARVGLRSKVPFRAVARLAVAGFGLVTASMIIATVLGGMTGLADLDVVGLSGARRLLTGLPPVTTMPPPVVLVAVGAAGTAIASFTVNAAVALGEEVGWRGYLVPALLPLGRTRAVILTGVIWAGWHAPIVLLGYDYAGSGRGAAMVALAGFTIAVGALLAWLRVGADSTLPAAVAHGAINGWMRMFPMFIAAGHPVLWLTASPMGVTGLITFGALAMWLLRRPRTPPSSSQLRGAPKPAVDARSRRFTAPRTLTDPRESSSRQRGDRPT